jgi:stringent starvation protein B
MAEKSTKPYLIRAIHEWCSDSNLTPYLSVRVDANTRVPAEYVRNGEIVLNVSYDATHRLTIGNDVIQFSARFNGVSRECSVPVDAVLGIFARENGQGLFFPPEETPAAPIEAESLPDSNSDAPSNGNGNGNGSGGRPKLQIVK